MLRDIKINYASKAGSITFTKVGELTKSEVNECLAYCWWRFRKSIRKESLSECGMEFQVKI
jgi:hypothetical protein